MQQLESTKLVEAIVSEYRHKNTRYALRRLAQTLLNDRKGEASCLGTSELLLVVGDLHVVVDTSGVLLLLGSNVWLQQPCIENKDRKARVGEYLSYSRDLRPGILSIYAIVSNGKGRLYSGLNCRKPE